MSKDSTLRKWLVRAGVFIAICTAMALMSAVTTYQHQSSYDKPVSWALAIRRSFKEWYAFGLLAIGVVWLGNRVRLESGHIRRWFAVHVPASLLLSRRTWRWFPSSKRASNPS